MNTLTRIDTHVFNVSPKTNWVFIAATDSDGAVGWGEASLIGWEPLLVAATAHLAPDWLGLSLDDAASQLRVSPQSPGGLVATRSPARCCRRGPACWCRPGKWRLRRCWGRYSAPR